MSYRIICSKGNVTDIIRTCESLDEAKNLLVGNITEIVSDYFDLKGKYKETHDYNLIKGIIYDKEAILEILEWEIYRDN